MAPSPPPARLVQEPSFLDVIIPLLTLMVSICGAVSLFGLNAIEGPVQVTLVICSMVASLIILKNGHP